MIVCSLLTNNFWLAMALTCAEQFFGENWLTPSLAMMQEETDSNSLGTVYTASHFFCGLSESIALGATTLLLTLSGAP